MLVLLMCTDTPLNLKPSIITMRPKCRSLWRDVSLICLGFALCFIFIQNFSTVQKIDCPPQKAVRESVPETIATPSEKPNRSIVTLERGHVTPHQPIRLNTASIHRKQKRPKYLKEELHVRDLLFVGVVTAAEFLDTRATAVNNTWAKKATKVEYFAAVGKNTHALPVVSLPGVDDTYPPQKKVYRMLRYMHDNYIDQYDWFMRADDDAYVRIPKLIQFLSQLDPSKELYIGSPGFGRENDLERIKLYKNEHYCMGGPGVIFSRGLLIKLVPHLEDCLKNVVVSWNEDLEVGRCISRRLNIQCTWAHEVC